jgi:hypothetical protein
VEKVGILVSVRLAVWKRVWVPFAGGVLAGATLLGLFAMRGPIPQPVVSEVSQAAQSTANGPSPDPSATRRWLIQLEGWQISVDGTEVELPSLAELWSRERSARAQDLGLSPYDLWIVSYARDAGLDWELVAAVIAEESQFDPEAVSERGAVGLMQVRPIAAAQVGEAEFADPESNIRTGVRYLRYLNELFRDVLPGERLPFVLAAYNMGPAHVRDAQALARKLGFDGRRWYGHVERVLPLLELEAFYRDLPAGYARGAHVLQYVQRVLARYEELVRDARSG